MYSYKREAERDFIHTHTHTTQHTKGKVTLVTKWPEAKEFWQLEAYI